MTESRPTSSARTATRRLSMVTVDQLAFAAAGLLITVIAARLLDVASFGLFGLVLICSITAHGVLRAWVGEPTLLHHDDARTAPAPLLAAAMALGTALGAVLALVGAASLLWHRELGLSLLLLGALTPGSMLHDYGRFLAFARHEPHRALALDTVRVALLLGFAALVATRADGGTVVALVAVWSLSSACAGALALVQHRGSLCRPSFGWLVRTWHFSWRYLLSFVATQGSALATTVLIAAIAGAAELGAVRGVLLLTGPFLTLQAAFLAASVAEVAAAPDDRALVERQAWRGTVLMLTIAAGNVAVLLLLPDAAGRALLGETWAPATALFAPAALHLLALGAITGVRAALLGRRAIRVTVLVDVGATVALLAGVVVGVSRDGALGAWWAIAWIQLGVAVVWWWVYLSHLRGFAPAAPLSQSGADTGSAAAAHTTPHADPVG